MQTIVCQNALLVNEGKIKANILKNKGEHIWNFYYQVENMNWIWVTFWPTIDADSSCTQRQWSWVHFFHSFCTLLAEELYCSIRWVFQFDFFSNPSWLNRIPYDEGPETIDAYAFTELFDFALINSDSPPKIIKFIQFTKHWSLSG